MPNRPRTPGTGPSRRSVLRLIGAAPLVAGAGLTATRTAVSAESATSNATTDGPIPRSLRPGGEFDQYVADLAGREEFSGTVLLRWRGHDVLSRSHGMADKEKEIPNGPDVLYTLGSVPKAMTAVAITQLVAAGKVAFHEKLGTYLEGFPEEVAETVTVHQLLTHTSGLTDFHRIDGFWAEAANWDTVEATWDGCLSYVRQDTLRFPAEYSNSAFFALGAIVAAVSGSDSYYDYVHEHVFEPAGMSATGFFTLADAREDPRFAHPYYRNDAGEWVDAVMESPQLYVGTPAGGAMATAHDLAKFAEAVMDDTLLGRSAWTQLATTPKEPIPQAGGTSYEAYGAVSRLAHGQYSLMKNGGSKGLSANVGWFPASGWAVVVLANYDDIATTVARRAHQLIAEA
ncbi:serine hydrolase [Jiangella sp. DSM 45060]|uniref:serine hydrolase domain-containing protein n=1 Tax=Jiangella sp. DSM 45060 TaxID=1798224 RepID=UPI00087B7E27|nr:serine hydrolase domain-containing protein [Jiangella sp. DSM 45060]SDT47040.1 CubicO group peptidase, beta-lactamase class C family [Jiangella sp. DSM 45060]